MRPPPGPKICGQVRKRRIVNQIICMDRAAGARVIHNRRRTIDGQYFWRCRARISRQRPCRRRFRSGRRERADRDGIRARRIGEINQRAIRAVIARQIRGIRWHG